MNRSLRLVVLVAAVSLLPAAARAEASAGGLSYGFGRRKGARLR